MVFIQIQQIIVMNVQKFLIVLNVNKLQRNVVSIMAEKKEKQYVSDNAQLMAEWNWEKMMELNQIPKY